MNRRNFLRNALGLGGAAIIAPVLPSEVWPFRKIFVPSFRPVQTFGPGYLLSQAPYPGRLTINDVMAQELILFEKKIPDLIFGKSLLYEFMPIPLEMNDVDRFLSQSPREVVRAGIRRFEKDSR